MANPGPPPIDTATGIDVSHHQGNIDWNQVQNAGYDFAFVKATEGVGFEDPNLAANILNGKSAGLVTGAYHFARPDLGNTAEEEAQYFVSIAGPYIEGGYLRPALDLECGGEPADFCTGGTILSPAELSQWVNQWMATVQSQTGVEPVIYVNSNYANNYLNGSVTQHDLWIAHWTYDPEALPNIGVWEDWAFWQYSDQGSVPGITGNVDLDLFNGNEIALRDFVVPVYSPVDLNCDTQINIFDVIILIQIIVGLLEYPQC